MHLWYYCCCCFFSLQTFHMQKPFIHSPSLADFSAELNCESYFNAASYGTFPMSRCRPCTNWKMPQIPTRIKSTFLTFADLTIADDLQSISIMLEIRRIINSIRLKITIWRQSVLSTINVFRFCCGYDGETKIVHRRLWWWQRQNFWFYYSDSGDSKLKAKKRE